MKGSIRFIAGLLVVMGAVGGIEVATDAQLIPLVAFAMAGLMVMASGTKAMKAQMA